MKHNQILAILICALCGGLLCLDLPSGLSAAKTSQRPSSLAPWDNGGSVLSQSSTALNRIEAKAELENQNGLQKTNLTHTATSDNIWTQIKTSDFQKLRLGKTTLPQTPIDPIGGASVTSSAGGTFPTTSQKQSVETQLGSTGNALVASPKGKLSLFVRDGITGYGVKSDILFSSSKDSHLLSTSEGGILEFVAESGRFDLTIDTPGYKQMKTFFFVNPNEEVKTNIWLDSESPHDPTETEDKSTAVVRGYVVDGASGKPIEGVNVYFTTIDNSIKTNKHGYFGIESETVSKLEGDQDDSQRRVNIEFTKESFRAYAIENFLLVKGVITLRITLEKGQGQVTENYFQSILDKQNENTDINEQPGNNQGQNFYDNERTSDISSPQSCPTLPTSIRVGTGCPTSGGNPVCNQVCTGTVQVMSLESYVQSGLDNEWFSSWSPASLQAGAVAYRTYGAYYVKNQPLANPNYDIRSDTCNQAWVSGTASSCINAANATVGEVLVNSSNVIVKPEYSAENNNAGCGNGFSGTGSSWPCISDSVCSGFANNGHGRGMCQWGSSRWATQGQNYSWILDHYYNPGNYYPCGSSCSLTSITPTIVSPGSSTGPGPIISTLTPTLTWTPVPGATNYGVYVRDILSNVLVVDTDCATATANYTVPSGSLTNNRQYRWNIRANISCGSCTSQYSSVLYFQTPTACNAPGAFSLSAPSNGQSLSSTTSVPLSWGVSPNADSYDVYFGTSSNPPLIANQTGTNRSVSVTPGQTYFWKVVAKVSCGSATSTSATWSFSVQQTCNAPGAFSLSAPSNGQSLSSTTSVNLTWGGSANADSYDVYFGTSSNPPLIANQTGTNRSVSVTPGQTYFWKVVAKVSCGSATSTSATWSFSVQQTCNAPGAFSLSAPSNGQSVSSTSSVTLSWGGSANADSYDVYFGTSSNPPLIANQTGTNRSVSVTPGQTYFWKVVAKVSCGSATSTSATWSFSVQQTCNAPGAFSLSAPSNGQSLSSTTSVNLTWGGSANADSYDVYFGTGSNPPFIANQTATSRSVSVAPGQTYYWIIVARVTCNSSLTYTAGTWSFSVANPSGGNATYDALFMAPKCAQGGSFCDSGALLNGRGTMNGGVEANQPNTINSTCGDGTSGTYHNDESLEAINISTLDGGNLAAGKGVRIDATVSAWTDPTTDHLDLYYAGDATNPNWIYLGTLEPSVPGIQVLTAIYTLPNGGNLQAVRANFRYQGTASPCGTNSGFDDYDDLIFTVGSGGTNRINVALVANGAVATASSQADVGRGANAANNGDRRGIHWGSDPATGSGWHSATTSQSWLQVDFNGSKTIDEIDVFSPQDNYTNPVDPTLGLTFNLYGVTAFDAQYWNGSTWVTVPNGSVTGNNKVWRQINFTAVATSKIRVLVNGSPDGYARLTEVEGWGTDNPNPLVNVALASRGAVASASSQWDAARGALATNNGDRKGIHWASDPATGSGWLDGTGNSYPDWLQIDFNGSQTISEIDLFSVQDNYANPIDPTDAMTFSLYGITNFDVQYWNGSGWVTVPGGSVTGNNLVKRKFSFSAITTTKIRVLVTNASDGYSRLTELEAWGPDNPTPTTLNVAQASNGGVASASSQWDVARGALSTNNGDRKGIHWASDPATGSGWLDATGNTYPDWLQIDFSGAKTINEIDLYCVQDNYASPVDPTDSMTFSLYGITNFDVQYWNGASWVTVPGGSVVGNSLIKRKFTFPPITTSKIRVLVSSSPDGYSRLTELEAWSSSTTPSPNLALASNGSVASASSQVDTARGATTTNNGDRRGLHWGSDPATGSGWHSATTTQSWLQIDFNSTKNLDEIDVFTVQDDYANPVDPTLTQTFSLYGVTAFDVQYWNGSSWVTVPGGSVTANDKVWRKFTFPAISTTKIRVLTNGSPDGYGRLTEIEAYLNNNGP